MNGPSGQNEIVIFLHASFSVILCFKQINQIIIISFFSRILFLYLNNCIWYFYSDSGHGDPRPELSRYRGSRSNNPGERFRNLSEAHCSHCQWCHWCPDCSISCLCGGVQKKVHSFQKGEGRLKLHLNTMCCWQCRCIVIVLVFVVCMVKFRKSFLPSQNLKTRPLI